MKRLLITLGFILIAVNGYAATNSYVQALPHHQLHVTLYPQRHALKVEDEISVPRGSPRTIKFSLHSNLNPTSIDAEIKFIGQARESWMNQYSVTLRKGKDNFTLEYSGEIFHPPQQEIREARTFESTPGIIAEEGVALDGSSGWYPILELEQSKGMLTFALEVEQPKNWRAISQGARSVASDGEVVWRERQAQNAIHLIAGPLKEYALSKDGVQAMVYLRYNDAAMAQRYLEAAVRYINMYQQLIGPYPYAKFALVENFWETGYGMPSFTLLGSQVIRLPFIIDTSFPHEILHNWWGNSVYVDYDKGNWSEGLTAYLADHLIQEQKGNGAQYRRSVLQKYADFVSSGRDFPLAQFTSRNSASSEAIGYGKAMMMFHMLRRQMEDDRFALVLQKFYSIYQFRQAGYTDLEQLSSQAARINFKPFFAQWTQQTGAPQLRLVSAQEEDDGDGYEVVVNIEQTQPGPAFLLEVPIVVTMLGEKEAYSAVIRMTGKQAMLHLPLKAKPLRVDVDPEYDLFRRLNSEEMPAAFSQVMGAEKLLTVLPSKAPEAMREQYLKLAQTWQQRVEMQIKWDDELEQLPTDGAVWLFGWENKFRGEFQSALNQKSVKLSDTEIMLGGKKLSRESDALAVAATIGKTPVAWLAAPSANMLPALAGKLPHYAKYSYAAFNGEGVDEASISGEKQPKKEWLGLPRPKGRSNLVELVNIVKGEWPATSSPLSMAVRQVDGSVKEVPRGKLAERRALVY